jgi:predicted nuclease with TOPRIM domain
MNICDEYKDVSNEYIKSIERIRFLMKESEVLNEKFQHIKQEYITLKEENESLNKIITMLFEMLKIKALI